MQILIVEDNRGDVLLVNEALKESNLQFELTHVADGEEAFEFLHRSGDHAGAPQPDLVLLDLNLPKRDGWDVLEEIRSLPDLNATPVVILSSSGSPDDLSRAGKAARSIYIRKPSNLDEFMAIGKRIERFWTDYDPGSAGR
jgi:chemotaxis family two-component system response regulator Rcp1